MNILFITPSFPSRYHRIRAFQLIQALSEVKGVKYLRPVAQITFSQPF
jgi:hypothetical protein